MCAMCHAMDLQGNGPNHTEFIPSPANLTLVKLALPMAFSIIKNGVPGTAMGSHPDFTEEKFKALRDYWDTQPWSTIREWERPWSLEISRNIGQNLGEDLYATACMGCHGKDGDGNGHWAKDDPHIWPKPANFHARSSDPGRLYYIISNGRDGTMMAPQKDKFPPIARYMMSMYVASFFNAESKATIPEPEGKMQQYKNPFKTSDAAAVHAGKETLDLYCVACHNADGKGSFLAPDLINRKWMYGGGTDNAVFSVVTKGIPGKLMASHRQLTEERRWKVITYLRSRGGLPDPLAGKQD